MLWLDLARNVRLANRMPIEHKIVNSIVKIS